MRQRVILARSKVLRSCSPYISIPVQILTRPNAQGLLSLLFCLITRCARCATVQPLPHNLTEYEKIPFPPFITKDPKSVTSLHAQHLVVRAYTSKSDPICLSVKKVLK